MDISFNPIENEKLSNSGMSAKFWFDFSRGFKSVTTLLASSLNFKHFDAVCEYLLYSFFRNYGYACLRIFMLWNVWIYRVPNYAQKVL